MNYVTSNLTNRLNRNDPGITQVSMRRMPSLALSSEEVTAIVKALQDNDHVETVEVSELTDTKGLLETLHLNKSITSFTAHQVTSDDAFTSLCAGLRENGTITEVSLGSPTQLNSSELSSTACEAVCDLLQTTKTIEKLLLRSFQLPDDGIVDLARGFATNSSLRELKLQQIESDHLDQLLPSLNKIDRLLIVDCDLDFDEHDQGKVHPLTRLISRSNATELRITECCFGNSEISALCKGMKSNNSIKLLDLTGNTLLATACKPLAEMLAVNKTLEHLILEENIIGDVGLELLSQELAKNTTLHQLNLKANHFGADGCEKLVDSLSTVSYLQQLDLSENDVGDAGARKLGELLKTNSHLRSLLLGACMISDDGISQLSQGLSENSTLQDLNLSNNCCHETGAEAVADMLAVNNTLQSLDMSSCHVSDSTLQRLLSSLKNGVNTTLKSLFLSFNAFSNAGAKHVADLLRKGSRLVTLSVQFNAFDSTGLSDMVSALSMNTYLQNFFAWNGTSETNDKDLQNEMDHMLALNQAGRRAINECKDQKSLWPNILERADSTYGPDGLFHFLREIPELVEDAQAQS